MNTDKLKFKVISNNESTKRLFHERHEKHEKLQDTNLRRDKLLGLTVRPELVEGWAVKPFMVRQAQGERLNLRLPRLKLVDKLHNMILSIVFFRVFRGFRGLCFIDLRLNSFKLWIGSES